MRGIGSRAEGDPAVSARERRFPGRPILGLSIAALVQAGVLFLLGGASLPRAAAPDSSFFLLGAGQKPDVTKRSNTFRKEERGDGFELAYGWNDFAGQGCRAEFSLAKRLIAESEAEFGYRQDELDLHLQAQSERLRQEMIRSLRNYVQNQFDRSPYRPYMSIEDKDPMTFNLKFSVPETVRDVDLRDRARDEFRVIVAAMSREQDRRTKRMEKDLEAQKAAFLESRGLRAIGDKIGVDYALCVERNESRVRAACDAIRRAKQDPNLLDVLSLLLAFIQEIPYGNPPLSEGQKYILGFWLPPRVLAENFGDCDSKGVTFASLWLSFRRFPVLIMKVPDHMFLAVAIPSIVPEGTITLNGQRYTLCEVTGPDKLPPGLITPYSRFYLESGQFQYEMVR